MSTERSEANCSPSHRLTSAGDKDVHRLGPQLPLAALPQALLDPPPQRPRGHAVHAGTLAIGVLHSPAMSSALKLDLRSKARVFILTASLPGGGRKNNTILKSPSVYDAGGIVASPCLPILLDVMQDAWDVVDVTLDDILARVHDGQHHGVVFEGHQPVLEQLPADVDLLVHAHHRHRAVHHHVALQLRLLGRQLQLLLAPAIEAQRDVDLDRWTKW